MIRDITPQMAGLVGSWCNSLLFGLTLVLYITCVYVLVKRRAERSRSTTWILLGTATIQFLLSLAFVAYGLRLLIEGFILADTSPIAVELYWINNAVPSQIASKAIYVTNSIVGDSIMVWRVYVVWGHSIYVALLPFLIVCATTVMGYMSIAKLTTVSPTDVDSIFLIARWILTTWCLSIATQIISTGLIAGRIWWISRRNSGGSKSRYTSLISIIIESGAIYTLSTVFLLTLFDLKAAAGAVAGNITAQIATIVPTLIIIRVELARSQGTFSIKSKSDFLLKTPASASDHIALSNLQRTQQSSNGEVSTLHSQKIGSEWIVAA